MSITPKGISILELYRLYRENSLIVNRRYQRKLVWAKSEKSSLIESILLKYPIPLILFGKFKKDGRDMYEIIDGMQRLNAIFSFIENQFSTNNKFFDVTKHPLANELSTQKVFQPIQTTTENLLTAQECVDFLEYSLAVTIYEAESNKQIEDVFNRINSNGKHLSAQDLTKGLIQSYFKISTSTTRSSGSYAIDLENYLRRSKTEAPNYDFKQGLVSLNPANRSFDQDCFEKICQNIAAMANLGKEKKGYIFLGVSDTEKDTKQIEKLDGISAHRFFPFGIVGIEREANIQNITLDQYILQISRKIRDSKLPEWLKTKINTSLTPITYHDHTVLMIEIHAGKEPVWYDNKLYIRDGHEKKAQEVSGEKISAVYSLFQ
jgi:hypothetical protein